jgi:peptide deformylase
MALLKIVAWPDPVLTTPAEPVTKFDDELKKLAEDMFETMYAAVPVRCTSSSSPIS